MRTVTWRLNESGSRRLVRSLVVAHFVFPLGGGGRGQLLTTMLQGERLPVVVAAHEALDVFENSDGAGEAREQVLGL